MPGDLKNLCQKGVLPDRSESDKRAHPQKGEVHAGGKLRFLNFLPLLADGPVI